MKIKNCSVGSLGWAVIFYAAASVRAGISTTGDVSPDPATSTSSTTIYVGNTADGSVSVDGGSSVTAGTAYLGYHTGVNGAVNVTGIGSAWSGGGTMYVGYDGNGAVNLSAGGQINADAYLGFDAGATGSATVSGTDSTWTGDFYVGFDGAGNLLVNNGGTITGYGYIGHDAGSAGSVILDGAGSKWTGAVGGIYVGNDGSGTLKVLNGATASSDSGFIGASSAGGEVTVDGAGSSWSGMSGGLYVGFLSQGKLTISHTANVSSDSGYVGGSGTAATGAVVIDGAGSAWSDNEAGVYIGADGKGSIKIVNGGELDSGYGYVGSSGVGAVAVDGPGSVWKNSGLLDIAYNGSSLSISNGGKVTGTSLTIDDPSALLTMTVGDGSALRIGAGTVTNNGIIRLTAARGAAEGSYTPITASSSSSWGSVQAIGGTWDGPSATFTITAPATGNAGSPVSFDLSQHQRVIISDSGSGHSVIANFQGSSNPSNLTLTATLLNAAQSDSLQSTLPSGQTIVTGWTFSAEGYTQEDPVYLSMDIGSDYSEANLDIWHYDGSTWTPYPVSDLSYDGEYASFTVTGFSGYAVSVVPEPAPAALVCTAGLMVLRRRRVIQRRTESVTL